MQLTKDEQENLTNLINYSLVSIAGKLSADEFLILARVYIGIAHDSVQNAKKPFEGMGDVRQIHYRHVTESIFMTSTCMLRLRELLNTTPHLPNTIAQFREQLIVEVNLVIAWMGPEGSDNRRQETKPRKEDVKKKFTRLLQKLDELDRHIQGRDLP